MIGGKGATVKKISRDCKCFIKIQDPNPFSGGMPWFLIRGNKSESICEAYHRLRTIANEADRRLPRMGSNQGIQNHQHMHPAPINLASVPKKKFKKEQVFRTTSYNICSALATCNSITNICPNITICINITIILSSKTPHCRANGSDQNFTLSHILQTNKHFYLNFKKIYFFTLFKVNL